MTTRKMGRRTTGFAVAVLSTALIAAGCSSSSDDEAPTDTGIAAIPSGPSQTLALTDPVAPIAPVMAMAAQPESHMLVALLADSPRGQTASSALVWAGGQAPETGRPVSLPTTATALARGRGADMLVALDGAVGILDTGAATLRTLPVDGKVLSVALGPDDGYVAGLDDGRTLALRPDGSVAHEIGGLKQVDGLAVVGGFAAALDRSQTAVAELNLSDDTIGLALRAGKSSLQLTSDHWGRVLVTDTRGAELLVFSVDDLVMRQRIPTHDSPYALTYDDATERAWVTLPATNQAVAYDLSTGNGVETARIPTVTAPDAIAVDPVTGEVLVASGTGDGLLRVIVRS